MFSKASEPEEGGREGGREGRGGEGRGGEGLTHSAVEPPRATGTHTVLIDRPLSRRLGGGRGRGCIGSGRAYRAPCVYLDLLPAKQAVEVEGGHVDGLHPIHSHVRPNDAAGVWNTGPETYRTHSPVSAAGLTQ